MHKIIRILGFLAALVGLITAIIVLITTVTKASSTPDSPATISDGFAGVWEGIDGYDGSIVTLSLAQTENQLIGTLTDTFSGNLEPPGYYGKGSGIVFSATTAQITFDLSRWDGDTAKWEFSLMLSEQNGTITLTNCFFNSEIDSDSCPIVMQRK